MKVKDVMTGSPQACLPETSLAEAASLMWEHDCGVLPVLDLERRVVGVITDRDICFGATTKNRAPSEIAVGETITRQVFTCGPEDDIHEALRTMRRERVRRLPVVADDGTLRGLLSMNDVVLRAEEGAQGKNQRLTYADVVKTYKAICGHAYTEEPAPRAATA